MRSVVASVASIGFALFLGACGLITEARYDREGIGTDFYRAEFAQETELQDLYIRYLCRLAAPSVGDPEERCVANASFDSSRWTLIVEAGLNDIDRRCDEFLNWLEYRKRTDKNLIALIGSAIADTTTILGATNTAQRSISIVGAALGFTKTAFNLYTERLITVAEKSTVQSVVFTELARYREDVVKKKIIFENRPAAIQALRNYLRICMPATIEAKINTTVTIYQQAGPDALVRKEKRDLVSTEQLGRPAPFTADAPAGKPTGRPPIPVIKEFSEIIDGYTPEEFPLSTVRALQSKLCAPASELGKVGDTTKSLIKIFKQTDLSPAENANIARDNDRIVIKEKKVLEQYTNCPRRFVRNFYERTKFGDGRAPNVQEILNITVINKLNKVVVPGRLDLSQNMTLNAVRTRIAEVRRELLKDPKLASQLMQLPRSMENQWTKDLDLVLTGLPERKKP